MPEALKKGHVNMVQNPKLRLAEEAQERPSEELQQEKLAMSTSRQRKENVVLGSRLFSKQVSK